MAKLIYLDHAATTAPDPHVLAAMQPAFDQAWGNASSAHGFGQAARKMVEEARVKVAALIGSRPEEVFFTSGATESNNTVIRGVLESHKSRGMHLVTTAVEHPSLLEPAHAMERQGWRVTLAKVDGTALVDPAEVRKALSPKTALVSVMLANNEVGTIEPVAEIAGLARAAGVPVHTDATQAVGRIPVDVGVLGVDYLSLSAHKIYGPKGVGALFVRRGAKLTPLIAGGEQEAGRRSGTLNVPGIVGLGAAAELARTELAARADWMTALRNRLEQGILARIPHCHVNGHPTLRLPSHLNVSVDFVEGEAMMMSLDLQGVAVSTGSACSSGSLDPSHVLTAMGFDAARAHASLRFSLGATTTEQEIEDTLTVLGPIVQRLRKMSPSYQDYLKKQAAEHTHAGV